MDLPSSSQPRTPEIRFLYGLRRGKTRLGLDSTRKLLQSLGSPERDVRVLQVAGTNGKGSTTAFAAAMLQSAGLRVGRFTSPHLLRVEERVCVDSQPISPDDFSRRVREMRPHIERSGASFFESMTALAALHFRDAGVDVAVYEVGLGGRLDATTALPAAMSIITSVGHDHEAILGRGLNAICGEKLGITRQGVPLHAAFERPDLIAQTRAHCSRNDVPLRLLPAGAASVIDLDLWTGMQFEIQGLSEPVRLWTRLLGAHHARNAALAAAAVLELAPQLPLRAPVDLAQGCLQAFMPARLQVLPAVGNEPTTILDVAHNPQSLHATFDVVEELLRTVRPVFILGMLRDKRLDGVIPRLARCARRIILTVPRVKRAWDLQAARSLLGRDCPDSVLESVPEVTAALQRASETAPTPVVVIGSHYLIGEVVPALALRRGQSPQALIVPQVLEEPRRAAG